MLSKRSLAITIIILIFLQLLGCGGQQKETKLSKENQTLNSLSKVTTTSEEIITKLEQFHSKMEDKKEKKADKAKRKEENKDQAKENNKNKEQQKSDKEQKEWKKIKGKITELHQGWNQYESQESIPERQLKFIEKELNSLTKAIEDKKVVASLLKVNQFNLGIADLYEDHDSARKGKLKKIMAYTRDIIYLSYLGSTTENKARQLTDSEKLKELLSKIKGQFKDDKKAKQKVKELTKAVEDLQAVINEGIKEVIEIKGELILSKVKELESK